MFTRRVAKRFSLLLLEEDEDYVDDWVATCQWPPSVSGNWQSLEQVSGRLRLCSKSLFFEPDDMRIPIVRLPLQQTQRLEPEGKKKFAIASSLVVKMKANAADAPYVFEKRGATWRFTLVYAQLSSFLPNAHQYLAASRLPYSERGSTLQALAQERMQSAAFDTSRLVDFGERVLYDGPATLLAPLVREGGRLVFTTQHLYFQALNNVSGDQPVRIHPLAGVAAVARRRSSLKPTGLEVFFVERPAVSGVPSWGAASAFFAFGSMEERERVANALMAEPSLGSGLAGGQSAAAAAASILEARGGWLQRVTAAWQRGRISNLDYLLFCNLAAGRSFNDLTQWPVFPWVLADYESAELDLDSRASFRDLSKPIGALNPDRLRHFQERYREMPRGKDMDPPFMYGTHYSCPGYVMYWLVRAAPGHLLRLQTGRFDAPDRLFFSIKESWNSVLTGTTDVKELIPEFFLSDSSFLVNRENLPLGKRQNGDVVGDVVLPPWAKGPEHFLQMQRAALESPFVSANLHHWLDLIFGYKQQGPAAVEANNVFHPLTYEGAVDMATVVDARERQALEAQINEFGQCPRQLFAGPHPPRLACPPSAPDDVPAAPDTGAGGAHALSVALVAMLRAATEFQDDATAAQPVPIEVSELLRKLDVVDADSGTVSGAMVDDVQAGRGSDTGETSEARPRAAGGANLPGRVRNWSGRLGGHLTSLVDNLGSKGNNGEAGRPNNIVADGRARAMEAVSGVSTSLKTLFQRHPPASQPVSSPLSASLDPNQAEPPVSPDPNQAESDAPDLAALSTSSAEADAALLEDLGLGASSPQTIEPPTLAARSPGSGGGDAEASTSGRGFESWGPGLRERLSDTPRIFEAQHGSASAVAAADVEEPMLYSVGSAGTLKILSLTTGAQVRSAKLADVPLTAIALVPLPANAGSAVHPLVLTSSYDNKVYAYSVEYGRLLGSLEAHDDAVSCLQLLGTPSLPSRLVTGSWDCTVKLWRLEEGRQPWGPSLSLPERELAEQDSAVWAVAAHPGGPVIVTGTEEGGVTGWDLRQATPAFQVRPSQEYIGGLAMTPDGGHVIVASGDGNVSLLEMRKLGTRLAYVSCGAPLRCCSTDGLTAVVGSEDGQAHVWDVAQQRGHAVVGGWAPPGPDGLYPPLRVPGGTSMNGLHVTWLSTGTSSERQVCVVGAHDSGQLSAFVGHS